MFSECDDFLFLRYGEPPFLNDELYNSRDPFRMTFTGSIDGNLQLGL